MRETGITVETSMPTLTTPGVNHMQNVWPSNRQQELAVQLLWIASFAKLAAG